MSDTSLKEKTAKGLFWGGFSNGIQQLLNLGFGIVLARLLDASDYGMVGMLTIFSAIAAALQEGGFISALTNRKETLHKDYNAVFWFSLMCSTTIYLSLILIGLVGSEMCIRDRHYYIYITLLCRTADCRLLRYARADTAVPSLLLGIRHFQHEHCTESVSVQESQNQGHYHHLHFESDSLRHCGHHTGCQRIRLLGYCIAKYLIRHRDDGSQFLLLALEALFPV